MSGPAVVLRDWFVVPASSARVRGVLDDVPGVIGCIPGAAVTGANDDGTYSGRIGVQYGETSVHLSGTIRRTAAAPLRVAVHAEGQDRLPSVRATGDITVELAPAGPAETEVAVTAEFSFSGVLAVVAGSATKIMGPRLLASFGRCLAERAGGGPPD